MKPDSLISVCVIAVIASLLIFQEMSREKVTPDSMDGCSLCHMPDTDPSPSHPVGVMGCTGCHMGNPFARNKTRAHIGMIKNPGNLQVAGKTCGQKNCHPDLPGRVEKSLMATNRGILAALQNLWPHENAESVQDVFELIKRPAGRSLALDHYRKMCGGCHLWRSRYPDLGEIGKRGGGCTDCHIKELETPNSDLSKKSFRHPGLTTRISTDNCLKCHNRSARIGLSYTGRFESEGYGTPFTKGGPGPRRLSGGRFFLELPADVHHRKAGLDCIDCHTEKGVMGDGKTYQHQEEQVDTTCKTCHDPVIRTDDPDSELTRRLVQANGRQPTIRRDFFIMSPKGSPLYHLHVNSDGKMILYRKHDGKPVRFVRLAKPKIHQAAYHKRLSCQACHSRWVPQCYGCHETFFGQADQRGWLTGKKRPGRWVEGRSYLRFRRPALGVRTDGSIGPFAPGCQVFIEAFDAEGCYMPEKSSRHLVMASFDPHTTALKPPTCEACHMDSKVIGLGEGALKITDTGLIFNPVYQSARSGLGIDFPLDAFVSAEGRPLQLTSRPGARPFSLEELERITRVSLCLPCHDRYDDKIFCDFSVSFSRFRMGEAPCGKEAP